MFDNTQKTNIDCIDKRILPGDGLINLWKFADFMGYSRIHDRPKHDEYLKLLVVELEKNEIPIIKVGNDIATWIIRLDNIR